MSRRILITAIVFLCISAGWIYLRPIEPSCLVILNSKYFDSKTSGYVANKKILISKELITDIIEPTDFPASYKSCRTLDLNGGYLYPGLIDSHTHSLAIDKQKVSSWKTALELSAKRPLMMRLFIGEKNAKSMLMAGFTGVRDLGNSGFHLDEQLLLRLNHKISAGPEMITSGPGITIGKSQINLIDNPQEYKIVDEDTDLNLLFKEYKDHHVSWIKIYADNSQRDELASKELLIKLTRKAKELNFKVALHAEFNGSISRALDANPDSIEHFYEIPLKDFKAVNPLPYIVLTDYSLKTCYNTSLEKNCSAKMLSLKNRIAWLKKNNFKIVFGSDAVLDFTSDFKTRGEAALSSLISLSEGGLTPIEIILAATATPAEMLDLPIGKIEKTYKANLVAYDSDPLSNPENLKNRILVLFKGEIICKSIAECQL